MHPPFTCLSVWPSLLINWETVPCCTVGAHTAAPGVRSRGRDEAGDADSNQPPAGPHAGTGADTDGNRSQAKGEAELAPAGQKVQGCGSKRPWNCYGVTTGSKEPTKARVVKRRGEKTALALKENNILTSHPRMRSLSHPKSQ